jgi:hypothetical protein
MKTNVHTPSLTALFSSDMRRLLLLYSIWRNSWIFAKAKTFIDAVLRRLCAVNAEAPRDVRYPTPDAGQLINCKADLLMLSSKPFPLRICRAHELAAIGMCSPKEFRLVDGAHYSWFRISNVSLFGK